MGGRINTPSAKPASAGAEITNHRGIRMCITYVHTYPVSNIDGATSSCGEHGYTAVLTATVGWHRLPGLPSSWDRNAQGNFGRRKNHFIEHYLTGLIFYDFDATKTKWIRVASLRFMNVRKDHLARVFVCIGMYPTY